MRLPVLEISGCPEKTVHFSNFSKCDMKSVNFTSKQRGRILFIVRFVSLWTNSSAIEDSPEFFSFFIWRAREPKITATTTSGGSYQHWRSSCDPKARELSSYQSSIASLFVPRSPWTLPPYPLIQQNYLLSKNKSGSIKQQILWVGSSSKFFSSSLSLLQSYRIVTYELEIKQ